MGTDSDPGGTATGNVAGDAGSGTPAPMGPGVEGVVTDASGNPVPVANISATGGDRTGESGPVSQEANVTDMEGRYFIPLTPGRWVLVVRAHGYRTAKLPVVVDENESTVREVVLEDS